MKNEIKNSAFGIWMGLSVLSLATGCGEGSESIPRDTSQVENSQSGKSDSGWLGSDTFEVDAIVRSTARQSPLGEWENLETDREVQLKLVDNQIKFIKNSAERLGWRFNQLAESVRVVSQDTTENGDIIIEYEAVIDMLGRQRGQEVPSLDQLESRRFSAMVPLSPTSFASQDIRGCSKVDDSHSVAAYNFHYYFAPDQTECEIDLTQAEVEVTEVFERPIVYPEYDQLLQELGDGRIGFRAALVPNRGDEDPASRFDAHARMLSGELGLEGVDSEDGTYRRYTWETEGVTMVIDLFDPTDLPWTTSFARAFRERLADYSLVHYNGHSSYGTKHLLDEPEAYSDAYQIIVMHSCQSYAYYTRQVFRAKATEEDPSGFASADVVATGKSSYPSGSPPTLRVLLTALMDGTAALHNGSPTKAPDWLTIAERMKGSTWGDIMYGIAGVRTNAWQPANL
jgi:hypothetical protein